MRTTDRRRPVVVIIGALALAVGATACSNGLALDAVVTTTTATPTVSGSPSASSAPSDGATNADGSPGNEASPVATTTPQGTATAPSGGPADDSSSGSPDESMFTSVAATVVDASGETCELCVWLADRPSLRGVGMMYVTDLAGRDGMAFVYPEPHGTRFWMKNTVMPLSIAFFDEDGQLMDSFDMEPCVADPCQTYPTPSLFITAIEVPQGGLNELGIEPGATLTISDLPCTGSSSASDDT